MGFFQQGLDQAKGMDAYKSGQSIYDFGLGKDVLQKFAQTDAASKYTPEMLSVLSSVRRVTTGQPGKGGYDQYFLPSGAQLQNLGPQYANLVTDFSGWAGNEKSTNDAYAAYLQLMQANPGRSGTLLGSNNNSANTVLGAGAGKTVLG